MSETSPITVQWQARRFYPDLYGGLEVVGYETVKALAAMGHEVSVMTENYPDGPFVTDEPIPGVKCTRIPTAGRGIFWRVGPWARVARWAWHERNAAQAAEVVIAVHPECVIASKLARRKRPVIYNCETVTTTNVHADSALQISRQQVQLERLAAKMADRIAVPSENTRDQLCQFANLAERDIAVVPHGIDVSRFLDAKPCQTMSDLKRAGFFLVIYVGRLHSEKGVDFAIDALSRMRHRRKTRLVFVGEGPEEPALRRQATEAGLTENVIFIGKVPNPQAYVAGADVLVLPSRREAFGIVLLEAMATGRPCVAWRSVPPATRVACSEIIVPGETGYCLEPFNTDDFAGCLDRLADDDALRRRMGQAGQKRCLDNYSWRHTAELYLQLA